MPTYKNIRIPKRGGGSRLQRVQVLASGKYKFVKNLKKKAGGSKKLKGKRSGSKGGRKVSRKLFGSLSGIGALEDVVVGFAGGALFRSMGQGANAVPLTRIVQGFAGHGFNRRGKSHLIRGIIDYVDNWLLSQVGLGAKKVAARPLAKLPILGKYL